ncbi:ABC-type branched-subunit amino acid transport system substrate-binding protein [Constrictibacter sp. MBR-5]|jgi:branched-chain amino acid transport system substrate-binding protein|uniref:ABC transporter substrate-binding protein n=1 Tax=Constrictibacter sp. MBR-5 TaxID=3156467 RepID=UPI003393930F
MRPVLASAAALAAMSFAIFGAQAQVSDDVVRIGVLTDMSGPYQDWAGPGSVVAVQMAVEDFGRTVLGKKIEVVSADHQNKADVGANLTRQAAGTPASWSRRSPPTRPSGRWRRAPVRW